MPSFRADGGFGGARNSLRPDRASNPSAFPLAANTLNQRVQKGAQQLRGNAGGGGQPSTQRSTQQTAPFTGPSVQPYQGPVGPVSFPDVAPAAPAMSEADFLNSDDVYLAALSRYNKSYDDLLADIKRRQGDYDVTYGNSLDDLGYIEPAQAGGAAGWDFQNQQTAAGRGYQSLIQDFAARGLLHSGDYLSAQNDFTSQLGKQFDSMNLAKQQFGEGLNQERTSGKSARDAGVGQARAEALARMAQMYGAV